MNLVKSLKHFWTVTLGVDCPDEVEMATSYGPETEELQASLERVEKLEQRLSSTSSNKAGKGGKSNKLDVPTATIDTKAAKEAAVKVAQEKTEKEQDTEIEK